MSKDFGAVSQTDHTRGSVPSVAQVTDSACCKNNIGSMIIKGHDKKMRNRDAAFIPNDLENAIS